MVGFPAFDELLATPYSVDHWEDDVIGYAQQLVAGLTAADWAALRQPRAAAPRSSLTGRRCLRGA